MTPPFSGMRIYSVTYFSQKNHKRGSRIILILSPENIPFYFPEIPEEKGGTIIFMRIFMFFIKSKPPLFFLWIFSGQITRTNYKDKLQEKL